MAKPKYEPASDEHRAFHAESVPLKRRYTRLAITRKQLEADMRDAAKRWDDGDVPIEVIADWLGIDRRTVYKYVGRPVPTRSRAAAK